METEAAGLALAHLEDSQRIGTPIGWLVIRGISDYSDVTRADSHHLVAAKNAAHVLEKMLPYLMSARS
jgi:adenosylhomocysteine nucleosidase